MSWGREKEKTNSVLMNQLSQWETVLIHKENLGKNVKHISSLSLKRVKGAEVFSHGEILLGSAHSWLFG